MDALHGWSRAAVLVIALACAAAAHAQGDKSAREREQIRKLQSANNKLQQEASALQAAKTKLEQELKELTGQTLALKSAAEAGSRRRAALEKELTRARVDIETERKEKTALTHKLAMLTNSHEALTKQQEQGVLAAQAGESERRRLEAAAAAQSAAQTAAQRKEIAMCSDRNEKLHQLGLELLDRYQKKGVRDALLQAEPFTGIKGVEVENVVEAYRDKLDAQKVMPGMR